MGKKRIHTQEELIRFYSTIPVYPLFSSSYIANWSFAVNAPLCEDDNGHVSFVSEEAKQRFLREYKRGMKA